MSQNQFCQNCPPEQKQACKAICPEVEEHLKKEVEVPQRELTIGLPVPKPWPDLISNTYLTDREREIVTLLGKGISRHDICQLLNIKRVDLRMHLTRIKKKCQI